MTDFEGLVRRLRDSDVRFILIEGFAGTVRGSPRITSTWTSSTRAMPRTTRALEPLSPYLRGAPPGLPFQLDTGTLARGLNFTLTTVMGDLDLLGEVAGGGTYERLLPHTDRIPVFGCEIDVVTLATLIRLKRAAGRPKDLESIAELEALLEERRHDQ